MRRRWIRPLIAAACLVCLAAAMPLAAGTRVYHDDELGFSLELPADWEASKGPLGVPLVAISPAESGNDTFRENVNVILDELPEAVSIDAYMAASVAEMKKYLTDFQGHEEGRIDLSDLPAGWLVYSHRMGQVKLKNLAYAILAGKTCYTITCSATPESFGRFRKAFDQICRSFKLSAGKPAGAGDKPARAPQSGTTETQPPAASQIPAARTAAPPPAGAVTAGFTVGVEQDGKAARIRDHQVKLRKKPFVLVINLPEPGGVYVHASLDPGCFMNARARKSLAEVTNPGNVAAESAFNPDKLLYLGGNITQYWYYASEADHRFDTAVRKGEAIVCRRTVANYVIAGAGGATGGIASLKGRQLHLVFVRTKPGATFGEEIELQREYLKIVFP
ncbi:MAG: hypothetical protein ACM3X6_06635 [Patescibacteria group bacterium]